MHCVQAMRPNNTLMLWYRFVWSFIFHPVQSGPLLSRPALSIDPAAYSCLYVLDLIDSLDGPWLLDHFTCRLYVRPAGRLRLVCFVTVYILLSVACTRERQVGLLLSMMSMFVISSQLARCRRKLSGNLHSSRFSSISCPSFKHPWIVYTPVLLYMWNLYSLSCQML